MECQDITVTIIVRSEWYIIIIYYYGICVVVVAVVVGERHHLHGGRHPTLLAAHSLSSGAALAGELWLIGLGGCR